MRKINRIILFGDSFIQGMGCYHKLESDGRMSYNKIPQQNTNEIISYNNLNSWEYLKNYFPNVEVLNYGIDGASNYRAFELLMNFIKKDYREDDLILLGFTSKLRDFQNQFNFIYNQPGINVLHNDNPIIGNPLAFDKYNKLNFLTNFDIPLSNLEKELTNEFIISYSNLIHSNSHMKYIANTNYLFLQLFVKKYNINLICFDLFENYIEDDFKFEIDTDIYVNYNSSKNDSMLNYLIEYESAYGYPDEFKSDMKHCVSYFENNFTYQIKDSDFKFEVVHPNQLGYNLFINYFCENILLKRYK